MADRTGTYERDGALDVKGTLGIAGVGLIGGSIAAAVRSRRLAARIIGFGRSKERLDAARQAGLIDEIATGYDAARQIDLFVCCLPVDRIADSVREAAGHMKPGSLITDAGSAKASICEAIGPAPAPGVRFVGSHPLAGSERQGFEHADADLFAGRTCIVTPTGTADAPAARDAAIFWNQLGSRVVEMSPDEHDEVLARTSHLPHVVSAAVAAGIRAGEEQYAAGGFRDVTRVAGGDPGLWSSILLANRDAMRGEIARHIDRCRAFATALEEADGDELCRLLAQSKARRDAFAESFK